MKSSDVTQQGCILRRFALATIGCLLFTAALTVLGSSAQAEEPSATAAPQPRVHRRFGGVLAESFGYHRGRPVTPAAPAAASIAPAGGAYRYGFPVESYRWGWFGARHYYPTVVWHRGYNRDSVRWGYRRGY